MRRCATLMDLDPLYLPCEDAVDNRVRRQPQFTLNHQRTGENPMIDLYFWPTGARRVEAQ
jgi:hypothetical protein